MEDKQKTLNPLIHFARDTGIGQTTFTKIILEQWR